jgi:HD-like signal output (HDOD) protein
VESETQILESLIEDLEANRLVLPTLPEVALKVRDAVDDVSANSSQIADIVATDAALSARLLQVANSPLYRPRFPIDNIHNAIARLGNTQVRNLVSSLVMQQMFQATSDVLDTRLRQLWEHASTVASIAYVLASQTDGLEKDQALLAGLIHDVGALPILVKSEDIPELLEDEEMLDTVLIKLHTMLGEKILQNWGFPDALAAVAAEHENLQRDPGTPPDYVDVVIVANLQSYIGTDHPHATVDWSTVPAFSRLGIETDVNIVDIEENQEAMEEIQAMLG